MTAYVNFEQPEAKRVAYEDGQSVARVFRPRAQVFTGADVPVFPNRVEAGGE